MVKVTIGDEKNFMLGIEHEANSWCGRSNELQIYTLFIK